MKISYGMARCRRLLLAVGAVAIMILTGCTVSTGGSSSPPPAGSTTQPAGATYNLPAGVKTLTVNNQAGTTQVTATSGAGQIHVVQRPAGKPTAYRKTAGSAATIGARCPGGIHLGDCHMDYQIQLPPGTALTVAGDAGRVILQAASPGHRSPPTPARSAAPAWAAGRSRWQPRSGRWTSRSPPRPPGSRSPPPREPSTSPCQAAPPTRSPPRLPSATKTSRCSATRTRPT